ncbi:kinase-like protein [Amniculicola lignicola CBS 123094]|uniref:Kinase-like protein n=1 Tax=Amniculicola lignicola CBS 123094 TaxID=1392246 RepID=A0A6A5WLF3_9PLEO|nr:kinase-like protein [Amniculicola lignicola CBS 123094]
MDWKRLRLKTNTIQRHERGCKLFGQKKYNEAEEVFQQVVREQEQTLGQDHKDTLNGKYWLGLVIYRQSKYSKAEEVLQQVASGQETTLGKDDRDTLDSKYLLGLVLYKQEKHSEAEEVLQHVAGRQETTIGRDHKDTRATIRLLEKLRLNSSPLLPANNTGRQAVNNRLSSLFSARHGSQGLYTDAEITEISVLLNHSTQRWSKVPRTYIILRTIGHLNLLDELIDVGFSDYWFPVTERGLPGCLLPTVRSSFVRAQSLVLTKSMDLEKGEKGKHCHYKQGESPPFESKAVLGAGGFGQVDRVLNLISFKEYARKQVPQSSAFQRRRKEDIQMFINEIKILKGLHHDHIVDLVGSYTDSRYIALIMSPVAEMDLGTYLARVTDSNRPELRTFFGCLVTALEYLHEHKVRHKDIKPANILVDHGKVLFADFGLSLDFTDADGSTTVSMVNGMTPRYCAPEVAQYEPRNIMSDIWSLGVVFMEMIVVLKGRTVQDMDGFFREAGSQQAFIRTNPDALPEYIAELEGIGNPLDNCALGWTRQMLSPEQRLRPTATSLAASIIAGQETGSISFCGICCRSPDEDFSDFE